MKLRITLMLLVLGALTNPALSQTVYLEENFDAGLGSFTESGGGGQGWFSGKDGTQAMDGTNMALIDDDANGNGAAGFTSYLTSGNLGEITTATGRMFVSFDYNLNVDCGESLSFEVYNGSSWEVLKKIIADDCGAWGCAYPRASIEITDKINVDLKFRIAYNDGTDCWGFYSGVDNFKVTDCELNQTGTAPTIFSSISTNLLPTSIYKVTIPEAGDWVFSTCESSINSELVLGTTCGFDTLFFDNDSCGNSGIIETTNLSAGDYYLRVKGKNATFGENVVKIYRKENDPGSYCLAYGEDCTDYIDTVIIAGENGGINNPTNCNKYVFYKDQISKMKIGQAYSYTVTRTVGYFAGVFGIYVDWNNDGDFQDDGETISVGSGPGPYIAAITPPNETSPGIKRLRIRTALAASTPDACGELSNGEVEDYQVEVLPLSTTTPPKTANDNVDTEFETLVNIAVLENDTQGTLPFDNNGVVVKQAPKNGTAEPVLLEGTIDYTPNTSFSGLDSFSYTVKDNAGTESNEAMVYVTVIPPVDTIVASNDLASVPFEGMDTISVLSNDIPENTEIDSATVTIESPPTKGTTEVLLKGEIKYTASASFEGNDTFTYMVKDTAGNNSNIATVFVTVLPDNVAPIAVNDDKSTSENSSVIIDVPENDSDPDGTLDLTSVAIVNAPANGNTEVNGTNGEIEYTPTPLFVGNDQFTYTINDNQGKTSNVATVFVEVLNIEDTIIAVNDNSFTQVNSNDTIFVLNNDTAKLTQIDTTSVSIVANPANGTASAEANGSIVYVPNTDYAGTDEFTYQVNDTLGKSSNIATVFVNVSAENTAPVANDDYDTTNKNEAVIVEVTSNDSDPDGSLDKTSVTVVSGPSNGSTLVNSVTGDIEYTPNLDFVGLDTFTYTVEDNEGLASNVATVYINVLQPNLKPQANNDLATTEFNTNVDIDLAVNDNDLDGSLDLSSITIEAEPSNGAVTIKTDGFVEYAPNLDFSGADTFLYSIKDNEGEGSNIASVFVTVNPPIPNEAPIAINDNETLAFNNPEDIDVAENDSDPDGSLDLESIVIEQNPSNGTATVKTGGEINYAPNLDYVGSDTFLYSIKDDEGATSNIATVFVTVNPDAPNVNPVANNDSVGTIESQPITIDILDNDEDEDGTFVIDSIVITQSPSNGTAEVNAEGKVDYIPTLGYIGVDTFMYTVEDNDDAISNTATVVISIEENIDPIAVNDEVSTDFETSLEVDILINDNDSDGEIDSSKTTILAQAINGTSVFNQTTFKVDYTPNSAFSGMDTFSYRIYDVLGDSSNIATVFITVNEEVINQSPVTKEDSAEVISGDSVIIFVLSNDTDFDGQIDSSSIILDQNPKNGIAKIEGEKVKYLSSEGFEGVDSFYYSITDTNGLTSNISLVKIFVSLPENEAPIAEKDEAAGNAGELITIDVLSNDGDDNGLDSSSITIIQAATKGVINITTDYKITYRSNSNFSGLDSFKYSICDNGSPTLCDEAWVVITVEAVITNESAPIANNDSIKTEKNQTVSIPVWKNDEDSQNDLDLGSISIVTAPTLGNTTVLNNGSIIYSPNQDAVGLDSLDYSICDNGFPVLCDTAKVLIDVFEISTGINSKNIISLKIYPNPATNVVNISADIEFIQVEIFDLLGKLHYSSTINPSFEATIKPQLIKGLYTIKVSNKDTMIINKLIFK